VSCTAGSPGGESVDLERREGATEPDPYDVDVDIADGFLADVDYSLVPPALFAGTVEDNEETPGEQSPGVSVCATCADGYTGSRGMRTWRTEDTACVRTR
jgi:hypothetical protein